MTMRSFKTVIVAVGLAASSSACAQSTESAAAPAPTAVPVCSYEVAAEYPHDSASFTQGLFVHNGALYETTGHEGQSRLAKLDLASGKAIKQSAFPADQFGEGSTILGDTIFAVTWRSGVGHRWNAKTLKYEGAFRYEGEGWGLANDGQSIILSDGSATLRFLDPKTFAVTKSVTVTHQGRPLEQINELEYIDGEIWANIWHSDMIVRIDPNTGQVTRFVDLWGLKDKAGARGSESVLNGIAWDARAKRLYVTGKYWPKLYEIKIGTCSV